MTAFKSEQRRVSVGDREFHFVSYEERPHNARRGEDALPPMWFMMSAGKRWPVMPHVPGQDPAELDGALRRWLEENVLGVRAR
jgi:hypothetical protein